MADRSTRDNNSNVETVQGLRYWPAIAVLCLGSLVSFYLHSVVVEREETANQAEFVNAANIISSSFQSEVDLDVGVLESIEGLYASSEEVERHEFESFVENPLSRHDDIQALEWVPYVKGSQRTHFEETARTAGFEDFRFTELDERGQLVEAATRKEYFPVFYVEPLEGNEEALGYDLASNPTHLKALKIARDTGQMIATGRVTLVQEDEDDFGVLICMPVYSEGTDRSTVDDLRSNLEGFFLGVFEIPDLVEESLETINQEGISFVLVDENAPPESRVLAHYRITEEKSGVVDTSVGGILESDRIKWKTTLNVPGRLWTMYFYQSPYYLGAYGPQSAWIVIAVGIPFSVLIAIYIFTTLRNTTRIEKLVLDLKKANISLEKEMAERKRVDKMLREKKVELERKNEELEAFMYMAAHDLRTPIVSIHGFFEILRRTLGDQLDEKQKWVMERISANLNHFDSLLGDLVAFSRISDDSVERVDHDVGAVIQQVLEENSETITALGAVVSVNEDLPPVHFNETRLYQMFSNLVSNSLKFSREGVRPEVEIGWKDGSDELPSGQTLFYLKDNGIGIDEEQLESVFGLFFRLGTDDDVGSGVGLAIVKRIIDLENGKIWIESVPGEGTTFFFTLPLAKNGPESRVPSP